MDAKEFERNFRVETDYWWNLGRFHMIRNFVRQAIHLPKGAKLVDLGCGTGGTTLWLKEFGDVTGVDASPEALAYCRRRGLKKLLRSPLERLRLPSRAFDAAFALDILEHVRDDAQALSEVHRILKPGGSLLVTVPAYQWLWSEHDEVCHHVRRYTRAELTRKLREAGFQVRRASYCITFLLLPLVALIRFRWLFKGDKKIMMAVVPLPKPLNALLVGVLRLEAWLLRYMDLPFGVSVVCLAKKR